MKGCASCAHFVPHPQYGYIGYCDDTDSVVMADAPPCREFVSSDVDRITAMIDLRGWTYCVNCRRAIFDAEEALEHAGRGHVLSVRFMRDEVAPEEVSTVD